MSDEAAKQGFGKMIAELVRPHLQPTLKDHDGLTLEEARAKHQEALEVFQRAALESKWDVEHCYLMLDLAIAKRTKASALVADLTEETNGLQALKEREADYKASIEKLEAAKKALAMAEQYVGKWEANVNAYAEKLDQQETFVVLLKARLAKGADVDLMALSFANTDEIRA